MQAPCPEIHCTPWPWRRLLWAVPAAACVAASSAWGQAEAPVAEQAAQWLAGQLKLKRDRVSVQAPDPRIKTPPCPAGLRFDNPFGNPNTIRVRCDGTQWLVFLRAQVAEDPKSAVAVPPGQGAGLAPTHTAGADPQGSARLPAEPVRGVMLTRSVPRGALLSPASVQAVLVPARDADTTLIADVSALDQVEAMRDLPAGVPLRRTDVRPAVLVRQGQWVLMTVGQGSGVLVTVRLEAMQDGRLGDRVMLKNTESGRTVSGVVTGLNAVRGA